MKINHGNCMYGWFVQCFTFHVLYKLYTKYSVPRKKSIPKWRQVLSVALHFQKYTAWNHFDIFCDIPDIGLGIQIKMSLLNSQLPLRLAIRYFSATKYAYLQSSNENEWTNSEILLQYSLNLNYAHELCGTEKWVNV